MRPFPRPDLITGLVLAGGAGRRHGGADKGLLLLQGEPLVAHAARRLAPQVAEVLISANRHLPSYRRWGHRVVSDAGLAVVGDDPARHGAAAASDRTAASPAAPGAPADGVPFDGPLAGILAGLRACGRPWLAVVPCDAPRLPDDLINRLSAALVEHAAPEPPPVALAATRDGIGALHLHPTAALVAADQLDRLAAFLAGGQRKVRDWMTGEPHVVVAFDDPSAFDNLNTPPDLARFEALSVPAR
jgi:molybdopterin-guanine dinucleotide biosynthesis protein A